MFDIGGVELLLIGALALIVVGPKDLPRMVRSVGQWVGRARGLAREFQIGMEDAARQTDLEDLRKTGDDVRRATEVGKDLKRDFSAIGSETRKAFDAATARGATGAAERVNAAAERERRIREAKQRDAEPNVGGGVRWDEDSGDGLGRPGPSAQPTAGFDAERRPPPARAVAERPVGQEAERDEETLARFQRGARGEDRG